MNFPKEYFLVSEEGESLDKVAFEWALLPNLAVKISSRFILDLAYLTKSIPAPWPEVPALPEERPCRVDQTQRNFSDWIDSHAFCDFLRNWCDGTMLYGNKAVLIDSSTDWQPYEAQLSGILKSTPISFDKYSLKNLCEAIGWVGLDVGNDGTMWLFIFSESRIAECEALSRMSKSKGMDVFRIFRSLSAGERLSLRAF